MVTVNAASLNPTRYILVTVLWCVLIFVSKSPSWNVSPNGNQPATIDLIKKEAEIRYNTTKESVRKFCSLKGEELKKVGGFGHDLENYWKERLWFGRKSGFLWCCNYKVASSTLVAHMVRVAGYDWTRYSAKLAHRKIPRNKWRTHIPQTLFPAPGGKTLKEANDGLLSFAFVRHPFSRLASTYFEKIVHEYKSRGDSSEYHWLHTAILVGFRASGDFGSPTPYPSPEEFARYVLEQNERGGIKSLDVHLRPQTVACPWCEIDFDVIALHDNFSSDLDFVFGSLNLMVSRAYVITNHARKSNARFSGSDRQEPIDE